MAKKSYNLFYSLMLQIAASGVGAWCFSKTLRQIDFVFLSMSEKSLTKILTSLPIITITTRGAKTGKPRPVPLLYLTNADNAAEFALVGTNFGNSRHPAWYLNLKANPEAEGAMDGITKRYIAHEAEGNEYDRYLQHAHDIFPGAPNYVRRIGDKRHIPIMVMRPIEDNTSY